MSGKGRAAWIELRYWMLRKAPRWLRTRRPLRRYYWQEDELAEVRRRASDLRRCLFPLSHTPRPHSEKENR